MKIFLDDRTLFGNDAGEDEKEPILISYFVNRREFERFLDPAVKLMIARGKKGTGKSALLVRFAHDRRTVNTIPEPVVLHVVPADLVAIREPPDTENSALLENYWKQVICAAINMELARLIGFAWKDNQLTLVEGAELAGFKGRSLIGSLLSRLVSKISIGGVELAHSPKGATDQEQLLKRIREEEKVKRPIWFLLDDIDTKFQNTPRQKAFVSSFFSACRNLAFDLKDVGIRATVRTDVFASLTGAEDLDKVHPQYTINIKWPAKQVESIVTHRILAYVARNYPGSLVAGTWTVEKNTDELLELVFTRMRWDNSTVRATHALRMLSGGRPRWMTQLCRMAGDRAVAEGEPRIRLHHIKQSMPEFGQLRLSDLYKEHQYQFAELKALLESFSRGSCVYSTDELLRHLGERYIGKRNPDSIPMVDGIQYKDERQLAQLLFKMGFVSGHSPDDRLPGMPEFVNFEDRSDLLEVTTNLDDGMSWEIQPAYRNVLGIAPPRT
ncbi:MAG TPA: hypothetical protein VKB34_22125 [Povalibacter sp.]|nr:hypothetical protein [Povalibacter sp.]